MMINAGSAVDAAAAPLPWWRTHRVFFITAAVCVALFGWMLTFGTGRLLVEDSFANFYDYQAQSWLHGHWDVPETALGGEAFSVGGKIYGYFGPTPALQRFPFAAAGIGFGRLTRAMMLIDYVGALLGAYFILREAARQSGQREPATWLTAAFTASVGIGSALFFLGSRAYVYHEAILCGVAFGLWSVWCSLRYLADPVSRWWTGAFICALLAVHARPPIGLFAFSLLGGVAVWHVIAGRRLAPLWIAALAALGMLSFNALGLIKFGTFDGCPLRFHVQYTPQRLAAIDGRNFHLSNVRFNAASYLWRPSAELRPHFPYVFLEYLDRKQYPESKIDYRDPTLALPYSMPALVFLAVVGAIAAVGARRSLMPLALLWVAAVPLFAAMLTAIAVTERYTADFCIFLIPAAAYGGVALIAAAAIWRRMAKTTVGVLAVAGAVIQFATTIHHQRAVVWGVPPEVQHQYETWQTRIDQAFGSRAFSH